jgi:hypothetical protein
MTNSSSTDQSQPWLHEQGEVTQEFGTARSSRSEAAAQDLLDAITTAPGHGVTRLSQPSA